MTSTHTFKTCASLARTLVRGSNTGTLTAKNQKEISSDMRVTQVHWTSAVRVRATAVPNRASPRAQEACSRREKDPKGIGTTQKSSRHFRGLVEKKIMSCLVIPCTAVSASLQIAKAHGSTPVLTGSGKTSEMSDKKDRI